MTKQPDPLVTAIEAADFEDAGDALANILGECAID